MAHPTSKYADFEGLRDQAVALRRAGLSRRQIRDRLHVDNNDILNRLLQGEPAPEWTKRPNAKDDLRAEARELRLKGWTYDRIQVELGCSKSSISLWVRDLPRPERKRSREEAAAIARRGWEAKLRLREEERQRTRAAATNEIGSPAGCAVSASSPRPSRGPPRAGTARGPSVTNRKNTGDTYRGCLRVDVRNGADLYRRIEGWWYGIVGAATSSDTRNRT
ncbi:MULTISPECIES: hypothetical protein [Streptomyces]|uniref:Helix-turn-helix domain-containing protein n=1 Tax=Streptomyces tendae TaxID=1932 RepID=A0ABX5ZXD5_STRTE|nr:hypothetical protein [Streptomyces tendae]QER89343.1 hypothetical protein F3L20_28860 [Streptomyces tendae]